MFRKQIIGIANVDRSSQVLALFERLPVLEKHTLFSGTYLYRPNKCPPPPPAPRYIVFKLHELKETAIPNTAKVKFYFRCNQYPRNIWRRARIKVLCFSPTDSKARVIQNSFTCSLHAVENT